MSAIVDTVRNLLDDGRRYGRLATLGVFTTTTAMPASVSADPGSLEAAKEFYSQGVRQYGDGDYEGALASFRRSFTEAPRPQHLYNMALCHSKLGDPKEAVGLLRQYLEEIGDSNPADAAEARGRLDCLRTYVDGKDRSLERNYMDAITQLERAVECSPAGEDRAAALYDLASTRELDGDIDGAATAYRRHLAELERPRPDHISRIEAKIIRLEAKIIRLEARARTQAQVPDDEEKAEAWVDPFASVTTRPPRESIGVGEAGQRQSWFGRHRYTTGFTVLGTTAALTGLGLGLDARRRYEDSGERPEDELTAANVGLVLGLAAGAGALISYLVERDREDPATSVEVTSRNGIPAVQGQTSTARDGL